MILCDHVFKRGIAILPGCDIGRYGNIVFQNPVLKDEDLKLIYCLKCIKCGVSKYYE